MSDLSEYKSFFNEIIEAINSAKYKTYKSINKFHIEHNFEIGKIIVENQKKHNWGKSIVDTLSKDINKVVDGVKGYSSQNLWRMRQFYLEYRNKPHFIKLAQKIPWGQNLLIMHMIKDDKEKEYYFSTTDKMGWSRAVLLNQIKGNAYKHHVTDLKHSNFDEALPVHLAEQANDALKSKYNLDFLGITKPILERELENRLVEQIRDLMLELGYGFSFIGNQYKLKLGQKEYFIDLLFYHRFLRCLVAIELKTVEFEPEFAGKMNFYLELLDKNEKHIDDNPSIGIILCPMKDNIEVEFALKINPKPIGVSNYKLTDELPKSLEGKVPSSEELKQMLTKAISNAGIKDHSEDDASN
ncbi:MAG: PDDEXK nuclease domain-containing protein [Bacteroidales bacterium]|nr:PDDEXK nuclease domain-containing protein [Bacteroidales bacterium]